MIFKSNKFDIPYADYIDTIKESSHIRYKYYGTGTKFTGTIFTELKDKTISDNTNFYNNMNIEETVEWLESCGEEIVFWIILIIACVFGFYFLDKKWWEENATKSKFYLQKRGERNRTESTVWNKHR